MIISYLKGFFRGLWRNKFHSLINIFGLAIGIASCLLILSYVYHEVNYDKHHDNADDLYRVYFKGQMGGNYLEAATTGGLMGRILFDELPEVTNHTRLLHFPRSVLVSYEDKNFYQEHIIYADSTFFDLFTYKFLRGDPQTALAEPRSIVLTHKAAKKYFGDEDPIGKMLKWNNDKSYQVVGIIEDSKNSSHINFEMLISHVTLYDHPVYSRYIDELFSFMTFNYVELEPGTEISEMNEKIAGIIEKYMGDDMREIGAELAYFIQPVQNIHLESHLTHELEDNGNKSSVYIFSAIAVLILVIACINFVNLSTAKATTRAKEVGLRKVLGANKQALFQQFMGETLIVTLISMAIALVVIDLLVPLIRKLTSGPFEIMIFEHWYFIPILIGFILIVTLIAGFYPAIYISSYNPIKVIKGNFARGSGKPIFRNVMVTLQFIITIFLIACTLVIFKQMDFTRKKELGVNIDNMIVAPMRSRQMFESFSSQKAELMQVSGVEEITAFSAYVGNFQQRRGYYAEGELSDNMWMIRNIQVDYNWMDVFDIDVVEGRDFSPTVKADSAAIIVNKALVKEVGWLDPIGKTISLPGPNLTDGPQFKVIGVTDDFNYASLHETVKPLIIHIDPDRVRYLGIKYDPSASSAVLARLTEKWEELNPGYPFDYFFLQDKFKQLYYSEKQMAGVFSNFTYLAIIIACLGLFGLVSFITEKRTKEIGIRKVLGSSVNDIIMLFNKNFFILVIIASAISIPLAWYAMNRWLQNFAYHTKIDWWIFVVSILAAIAISVITVTIQTYKSASKNPVEAIKYE